MLVCASIFIGQNVCACSFLIDITQGYQQSPEKTCGLLVCILFCAGISCILFSHMVHHGQECLLQLRVLYKLPSLCQAQIFITCLGASGQSILAFYSARKLAENKYLGLLRQLKHTAVDKYLVLVNLQLVVLCTQACLCPPCCPWECRHQGLLSMLSA